MSDLKYNIYSTLLNTDTPVTVNQLRANSDLGNEIFNDAIIIDYASPHNLINGDKVYLDIGVQAPSTDIFVPSLIGIYEVEQVLSNTSILTSTKFLNTQLNSDVKLSLDGSNVIFFELFEGLSLAVNNITSTKLNKTEINPLNGQLVNFKWKRQKKSLVYSFELATELIIGKPDYDLLKPIEESCGLNCSPIYLEIKKSCSSKVFFKGKFTMRDAKIDPFRCEMEISISTNDIQDCIEENKKEEVNLFDIVSNREETNATIVPSNLEFLFCPCPDTVNPCNGENTTTDGWKLFLDDCGQQGGVSNTITNSGTDSIKDHAISDDYAVFVYNNADNNMYWNELGTATFGAIAKPTDVDVLAGSLKIHGRTGCFIGNDSNLGIFEQFYVFDIPTGACTTLIALGNTQPFIRGNEVWGSYVVNWIRDIPGARSIRFYEIKNSPLTIDNHFFTGFFTLPPSGLTPKLKFNKLVFIDMEQTGIDEFLYYYEPTTRTKIQLDVALNSNSDVILDFNITENHIIWTRTNNSVGEHQLKIYDVGTGLTTTQTNSSSLYEFSFIRTSDCVNGNIFVSVSTRENTPFHRYQYKYHSFDGNWISGNAGTNQVVDGVSETVIYNDLIGYEAYSNTQNSSRYRDFNGYVLFDPLPTIIQMTTVPDSSITQMFVYDDSIITIYFNGVDFSTYDYEVSTGSSLLTNYPLGLNLPKSNCLCNFIYLTTFPLNTVQLYGCYIQNVNENVIFFREKITLPCNEADEPVLPSGGGWVEPPYEDNCSIDGTATYVRTPIFTPPTQYEVVEVACTPTERPTPPDNTNNWYLITEPNGNWCVNGFAFFWLIPSVSGSGSINYDNAMLFNDVLDKTFRYLCPEIRTVKSEFFAFDEYAKDDFTYPNNYITGDKNYSFLTLSQKSDITRPNTSENATVANITLEDILKWLYNMFEVYYTIENGSICIEHVSKITENIGIDLTDSKYDDFTVKLGYKYDTEVPFKENFEFEDANNTDFFGKPIEYRYENGKKNLCSKGENKDGKLDDLTTDITFLQLQNDIENRENFVMLSNKKNVLTGEYDVIGGIGILSGSVVINNPLTWSMLHDNFKRHYRYLKFGSLNGILTDFESSKPDLEMDEVVIPFCCEENFEPQKKINTKYGLGTVEDAELSWSEKKLSLKLKIEKC